MKLQRCFSAMQIMLEIPFSLFAAQLLISAVLRSLEYVLILEEIYQILLYM